jgi:signal transduction histidine kinase
LTEGRTQRRSPRLHHLLFGVALALLVALAVWWIVLMTRTISAEEELVRERIRLQAVVQATMLAGDPSRPPEVGPLPGGELEVLPAGPGLGAPIGATGLAVAPTGQLLAGLEERVLRQRFMVIGEGSLLVLLVGACVLMLYRLVATERRYRKDVEHFLSRVTHEMKTPLAGLKALLESVREGRVPAESLPRLAALGLRQAERQEHLIENLLTANRFASGRASAARERLDLTELLESFVAHRRDSMALPGDRHALDCPAHLEARGDAGAVLTILDNLADNADKYGASHLRVAARSTGNRILVEVRDDGDGFAPGRADGLFEAFKRGASKGAGAKHGTGLGLHISRELAREMGGDLEAASEGPGHGACFTLHLPAADQEAS